MVGHAPHNMKGFDPSKAHHAKALETIMEHFKKVYPDLVDRERVLAAFRAVLYPFNKNRCFYVFQGKSSANGKSASMQLLEAACGGGDGGLCNSKAIIKTLYAKKFADGEVCVVPAGFLQSAKGR
jgi:hypothetical protein